MDIVHYFEKVVRIANMNTRTVYKLIQRVIVKLLNVVAQKYFVLVHLAIVSILEVVSLNVEQFIVILARTFRVLTFCNVKVYYSHNGHFFSLILVVPFREISHLIDLYNEVYVSLDFFDSRLH